MLTSKYIAHFLTEVTGWQKKLSIADQVISILLEVQRTWSHLESIFIGSEDIRNQLPTDSKRFDGIDKDFKVRNKKDNFINKNHLVITNRFKI
jgi:dynein heavy chain